MLTFVCRNGGRDVRPHKRSLESFKRDYSRYKHLFLLTFTFTGAFFVLLLSFSAGRERVRENEERVKVRVCFKIDRCEDELLPT